MATIIIDAGHGGSEVGTQGTTAGQTYYEKDMNLDIAMRLKAFLETVNPKPNIVMTRTIDTYLSVCDRGTFAKTYNADVFVSIHNNSFDGNSCGTLTLYPDSGIENYLGSKEFAQCVQVGMLNYLNAKGWGMTDRGVDNFRTGLGVFRCSAPIPACLVEVAFMDCSSDLGKLLQGEFRDDTAYGIAAGIINYLNTIKGMGLSQPLREPPISNPPPEQPPQQQYAGTGFILPAIIFATVFALGIYVFRTDVRQSQVIKRDI